MADQVKKLGVDLVKKAIKFTYDTTMEGIEAFKDKKLSLQEILGFGDNIYTGITIGLKSAELWAQIKDIDSDEGNELVIYTGELIKDATPEQIDVIIENAVQIIQKEIAVYNENIKPIIAIIQGMKK